MLKKDRISIDRQALSGFKRSIKQFLRSKEAGQKAKLFFGLLFLLLFGINALNVLNSYVGRDFMTAIENRNGDEFLRLALVYIGVFAVSTVVSVFFRFTEERLGLVWREWATRQALVTYACNRVYHRLKLKGDVANPDQRMADDIRTFSITTLSFVLMLLNSTFTVLAFSGVLWSISPLLFLISMLYAIAGTFLIFLTGRPLVRLNFDQMDKEADFRSSLIYLRGNTEQIALSRREGHLIQFNLKNLAGLVANLRQIIAINRNVNFCSTGYNWLIQIIPPLFVAPLFIDGKVAFGVITQSAIAFSQLLGAFSLIVTQFQSISSYTATFARLSTLFDATRRERRAALTSTSFTIEDKRIAYQDLTLHSRRTKRLLIKSLSIEIPAGKHLLIRGTDDTTRSALLYATADLWELSGGHVVRPRLEKILLLPELPYLPPATARELLMRPLPEEEGDIDRLLTEIQVPEERIMSVLRTLEIHSALENLGGLDKRQYWQNILPLDTQQLLVVARLLLAEPQFVLLDRPSSTLDPEQVEKILGLFATNGITYVTFEDKERPTDLDRYDLLLDLEAEGNWTVSPIKDGIIMATKPAAATDPAVNPAQ